MATGDSNGRRGRALALFRAGLVGSLLAICLAVSPAGESLDWQWRDVLLRLRGPRQTRAKVAVIAIADSTLEAWPEPMLFWGPRYAAAIEGARKAGAKWIGLDVIPAVSADEWLTQRYPSLAERPRELPDRQLQIALLGGTVALSYTATRRPHERLTSLPPLDGNLGFTDSTFSDETHVRRLRLRRGDGPNREIGLAALLAQRAIGIGPEDGAKLQIAEEVWVNYLGPPGSVLTLPAERVAAGKLSAAEREALQEAVVLVGPTFNGSNDLHQGPSGHWYPGVEIQAHAVATLIDARPLRVPASPWVAAALLAIGLVLSALGARLDSGWKAVLFGGLGIGWGAAAVGAVKADLLLPSVGPYLVILLTPLAQKFWLAREESHRRRRVEALFGEHVSQTVAKRLLEGAPVPADGERRTITVLFADIRGFTALSEKAPPEQVVRLLNESLSALSESVLAADGTLDKYVGDCVMAFWNAPSDQPDHAARGLGAALAMQQTIHGLNGRLEKQGLPAISVRIGISTGEAVVGSIGSPALRDYTVIGNTVNLASRLESANKELGTSILMGEATYLAAKEFSLTAREHSLAIRGVEAAVIAYSLSAPVEAS